MKYTIKAHGLNDDYSMEFSSYTAADAKQRLERFVDLAQPHVQDSLSTNNLDLSFRISPEHITSSGINLSAGHATDTIKF